MLEHLVARRKILELPLLRIVDDQVEPLRQRPSDALEPRLVPTGPGRELDVVDRLAVRRSRRRRQVGPRRPTRRIAVRIGDPQLVRPERVTLAPRHDVAERARCGSGCGGRRRHGQYRRRACGRRRDGQHRRRTRDRLGSGGRGSDRWLGRRTRYDRLRDGRRGLGDRSLRTRRRDGLARRRPARALAHLEHALARRRRRLLLLLGRRRRTRRAERQRQRRRSSRDGSRRGRGSDDRVRVVASEERTLDGLGLEARVLRREGSSGWRRVLCGRDGAGHGEGDQTLSDSSAECSKLARSPQQMRSSTERTSERVASACGRPLRSLLTLSRCSRDELAPWRLRRCRRHARFRPLTARASWQKRP